MHWCQDETYAVMSGVPVVGYLFRKVHKWYHNKTHHKCHHDGCESNHVEHTSDGEVMIPNPEGWESFSMETVDTMFGELATSFLMFDRRVLKSYNFPETNEFTWFIVGNDLKARWKNKFFAWDGTEWKNIPDIVPPTKDEQFDTACSLLRELVADAQALYDLYGDSKSIAIRSTERFLESL